MNIVKRPASAMSAFRPRSLEDQFGRLVENMFDDMFTPFTRGGALSQWSEEGSSTPRMNVTENDQGFEIEAEMPGIKKEDIKVAIDKQRVTIEGESQRENAQRDGEKVVYSERSERRFVRSFTLPSEVDEGSAQARLENGILHLSLPKKQGSAATRLTIQ